MPATINPIRKARLKKELLNPKNSIKDALLKSGYEPTTANNSGNVKAVKICYQEIKHSLKAADITPDWLLRRFDTTQAAAFKTKDFSTALAADVAIAKFVAQIAEKHDIQFSEEEKSEFGRIRAQIQLNITAQTNADKPQITTQPDETQAVKV